MLEIAELDDLAAMREAFARLARSPGLPPVDQRVDPQHADEIRAALAAAGLAGRDLSSLETWAIAMAINRSSGPPGKSIERRLLAGWDARPVLEVEGVDDQLGAFDSLTAALQGELLVEVIGNNAAPGERERLIEAWRTGDTDTLTALTMRGALANPDLRERLLIARNRAWLPAVMRIMDEVQAPFFAVGAGHLVGPDGLPAMLAAQGYTVTRLQ